MVYDRAHGTIMDISMDNGFVGRRLRRLRVPAFTLIELLVVVSIILMVVGRKNEEVTES